MLPLYKVNSVGQALRTDHVSTQGQDKRDGCNGKVILEKGRSVEQACNIFYILHWILYSYLR